MSDVPTDHQLLQQFARRGDRGAFDALVRRYLSPVYGSALRQIRDPHAADDITQAVFLLLMNKAASISTSTHLAGWLFLTTRYAVANYRKTALRRTHHEKQTPIKGDDMTPQTALQLTDTIDTAISKLKRSDRDLILQHYFQHQSLETIGSQINLSPESTRKRLNRVVGKLKQILTGSNNTSPDVMLSLSALAATEIPSATLESIVTSLNTGGSSTAISISKGVTTMLKITKIKIIALSSTAILLSGGIVATVHNMLAAQTVAATQTTPSSKYIAQLKNGVEIELLGIVDDPKTVSQWWKPDGSPSAQSPQKSRNFSSNYVPRDPGAVRREMHFRKTISLSDGTSVAIRADPVARADRYTSFSNEASMEMVQSVFFISVDKEPEIKVRWKIAAGQFKVGGRTINGGSSFASFGDPDKAAILGQPHQVGKDVIVTIMGELQDYDVQLIATTNDGKSILGKHEFASSLEKMTMYEYRFPNLSIENMMEYRFESRPFDQWAEFQNVSLIPDVKSDFKIITSDDPAAVISTTQPAATVTGPSPAALKTAPFTDILFKGEKIEVQVDGTMYELLAINETITADQLVSASKHYDPANWQRRIAEDLVEMTNKEGLPLANIVELKLRTLDKEAKILYITCPMTEGNRRAVYDKRTQRGDK